MTDLVGFLCARLDEDERVARAVRGPDGAETVASHIVRNHPARVLAEVEAKRRILARHVLSPPSENPELPWDNVADCQFDGEPWPCPDILDLALPYADHPDYRNGWRS
jgi:hypothetical protein